MRAGALLDAPDEPPCEAMPDGADALCDCCGDPCCAETGRDPRFDDHVLCAACSEDLRPLRLEAHREAAE